MLRCARCFAKTTPPVISARCLLCWAQATASNQAKQGLPPQPSDDTWRLNSTLLHGDSVFGSDRLDCAAGRWALSADCLFDLLPKRTVSLPKSAACNGSELRITSRWFAHKPAVDNRFVAGQHPAQSLPEQRGTAFQRLPHKQRLSVYGSPRRGRYRFAASTFPGPIQTHIRTESGIFRQRKIKVHDIGKRHRSNDFGQSLRSARWYLYIRLDYAETHFQVGISEPITAHQTARHAHTAVLRPARHAPFLSALAGGITPIRIDRISLSNPAWYTGNLWGQNGTVQTSHPAQSDFDCGRAFVAQAIRNWTA